MKKKIIKYLCFLCCLFLKVDVIADQEDVLNFFDNNYGVYAFEHGDGNEKSLMVYIHILTTDDVESDFNEKSEEIMHKISDAMYHDWYNYKYVMLEVWNEDFGRILSQTYDADTFEMRQNYEWLSGSAMNDLLVEDMSDDESEVSCEYKDMAVKYLRHEVTWNDMDEKVLAVYYEFTNNSNQNKAFMYSFDDKCFQNGVEIEKSWWRLNDETDNSGKEIRPGTTVIVASAFVIDDAVDNIELELKPFLGDKALLSMNLEME